MVKELEDKIVYLLGSLKNRDGIIPFGNELRRMGFKEVFNAWIAPGPEADDFWRDYEKKSGQTYAQALKNWAGTHIFEFDSFHIERCDFGIMCMPCGKSGHLELGNILGSGKRGYILFDGEPDRWDVMYQFADGLYFNKEDLKKELIENAWKPTERNSFGNVFTWFHLARQSGMEDKIAKIYVKERVEKMMDNYRGYEREALKPQYESALALLAA